MARNDILERIKFFLDKHKNPVNANDHIFEEVSKGLEFMLLYLLQVQIVNPNVAPKTIDEFLDAFLLRLAPPGTIPDEYLEAHNVRLATWLGLYEEGGELGLIGNRLLQYNYTLPEMEMLAYNLATSNNLDSKGLVMHIGIILSAITGIKPTPKSNYFWWLLLIPAYILYKNKKG